MQFLLQDFAAFDEVGAAGFQRAAGVPPEGGGDGVDVADISGAFYFFEDKLEEIASFHR